MMLLLWMACDDTNFPTPEGGGAVSGDSFADVKTILEGDCLTCHSAGAKLGGLDLETDACAALVDVDSSYGAKLVAPGDHAASVLWAKMEDSGEYGGVMPQGGKVAQASIDTVAAWIDKGASCTDTGATDSGGTDSGGTGATQYTFAEVQAQIFEPHCVSCHTPGGAYTGLDLRADVAYDNLVGVASSQRPGMNFIEPGNPELSYLMHKIRGIDYEEAIMPQGEMLEPELVALAYGWVLSGAAE